MDWVLYGIDWYSRFAGRWHILTCDYATSANQGDWPTIMQCPLALQMKSTRRPHLRMTSREIHYIRCLCRPSNNLSTKIMLNWVFAKHAQICFCMSAGNQLSSQRRSTERQRAYNCIQHTCLQLRVCDEGRNDADHCLSKYEVFACLNGKVAESGCDLKVQVRLRLPARTKRSNSSTSRSPRHLAFCQLTLGHKRKQ